MTTVKQEQADADQGSEKPEFVFDESAFKLYFGGRVLSSACDGADLTKFPFKVIAFVYGQVRFHHESWLSSPPHQLAPS